MKSRDLFRLSLRALMAQTHRTALTALGIAVGIAAVVLLTSIGAGIQRLVLTEFVQFGTNILRVEPGKVTTKGTAGAVIANVKPLTLEDAVALMPIRGVEAIVPLVSGNVDVKVANRKRRMTVLGVGSQAPELWQFYPAVGRFLPDDAPRTARPFVVLGSKAREELFGTDRPIGALIRIAGEPYRVVGVMQPKGQMTGIDLDDSVYIPTGRALAMFNREGASEINVLFDKNADSSSIADEVNRILDVRHGTSDFTISTQEEMLESLGSILGILTLAVGGLGGISLIVGGVGVLTIMTISVSERTREIGLLRAIGSRKRQIMALFLIEAVALSGLGGIAGLILGVGGAWMLGFLIPALPVKISPEFILLAEMLAIFVGLVAGVAPARNAASLDPVEALRGE
jgi:putative ABC transport system permease protein